ncbi:hypothetical protein BKA81DRAFT_415958, partial [Phyllosticta paracitricarpa]
LDPQKAHLARDYYVTVHPTNLPGQLQKTGKETSNVGRRAVPQSHYLSPPVLLSLSPLKPTVQSLTTSSPSAKANTQPNQTTQIRSNHSHYNHRNHELLELLLLLILLHVLVHHQHQLRRQRQQQQQQQQQANARPSLHARGALEPVGLGHAHHDADARPAAHPRDALLRRPRPRAPALPRQLPAEAACRHRPGPRRRDSRRPRRLC